MKNELKNLPEIFKEFPEIKLVYFFGSKNKGTAGPLSDFDFAIYLDEKNTKKMYDLKFVLQDKISRQLEDNRVDILILNLTEGPEIKYQIIKDGQLIYEQEPYKVLIEPKILNEYFDFRHLLLKYNLTKA